jgi:hypothetical protein
MRSELTEISLIDRYLFRQLNDEDRKTFEASLLVDETLADSVEAQRKAHRLVRLYARNKERSRLETIYHRLLREPAFLHQLKTIFT